jgi:hypothetical protein
LADLQNPKLMYAKAFMLLLIGLMAFGLLLLPQSLWARVVLQVLMVWAFARAYYFAFYVVQHYVDDGFRFSGLLGFLRHVIGRKTKASRLQASPATGGSGSTPTAAGVKAGSPNGTKPSET